MNYFTELFAGKAIKEIIFSKDKHVATIVTTDGCIITLKSPSKLEVTASGPNEDSSEGG